MTPPEGPGVGETSGSCQCRSSAPGALDSNDPAASRTASVLNFRRASWPTRQPAAEPLSSEKLEAAWPKPLLLDSEPHLGGFSLSTVNEEEALPWWLRVLPGAAGTVGLSRSVDQKETCSNICPAVSTSSWLDAASCLMLRFCPGISLNQITNGGINKARCSRA